MGKLSILLAIWGFFVEWGTDRAVIFLAVSAFLNLLIAFNALIQAKPKGKD